MAWGLKITDSKALTAKLNGVKSRVSPAAVLPVIGRRVVNTEIPLVFRKGGPNWKIPLRGGQALRDRKILQNSFLWRMKGRNRLEIGTAHPGAKTLNEGAPPIRIVPKAAKWLTIPFGPNLSNAERQTFRLRQYANVKFVPISAKKMLAVQRIKGHVDRLIAVLVKGIGGPGEPRIDKRVFLSWKLYGKSAEAAARRYMAKGAK